MDVPLTSLAFSTVPAFSSLAPTAVSSTVGLGLWEYAVSRGARSYNIVSVRAHLQLVSRVLGLGKWT